MANSRKHEMPSARPRASRTPTFVGSERRPRLPAAEAKSRMADKAKAEARPPADRKPETAPAATAALARSHGRLPDDRGNSLRRPLLFALLPLALVVGGYFYVTGGSRHVDRQRLCPGRHGRTCRPTSPASSARSTSTTTRRSRRATSCSSSIARQFRSRSTGPTRSSAGTATISRALQANYRNMQAQIEQAQKDVDFNIRQLPAPGAARSPTISRRRRRSTTPPAILQVAQQKLASLSSSSPASPPI